MPVSFNNIIWNSPDSIKNKFPYVIFAFWTTLLIILLYGFTGTFFQSVFSSKGCSNYLPVMLGICQLLVLLPAPFVFLRYSPLSKKDILRLDGKPSLIQLVIGILGIIAFQFVTAGVSILQENLIPNSLSAFYESNKLQIYETYRNLFSGVGPVAFFQALVVGALLPAFSEEVLFRGYMQKHFEQKLSPRLSIILTGLFFGLIHLNIIQIVPLVIIGIYSAFFAYSTKSLIIPIIIHFANNLFAVLALYYTPLSKIEDYSNNLSIFLATIFVIGGLAIITACCFIVHKLELKNKK